MDECNPPQPCVDNPQTPQDECNPPQPCVDNPDTPKDECNPPPKPPKDDDDVLGNITPNINPPDRVQPRPPGRPVLPNTGASVNSYLWLALLLMGAGALLMWRTGNRNGANA
jgi:LPXTG-motif cell wall-anchored protein